MDKETKLRNYIQDQLGRADVRARAYIIDATTGRKRPRRDAFANLSDYIKNFASGGNRQSRWVAVSGLRGTGKTTLLAQLYSDLAVDRQRKLFISVDHIVQLLGSNITDTISAYESVIGEALESLSEPLYLFIDEVQYDPHWAVALKSIYDRTPDVFIISTGSSALEINANSDTARRAITETLLPMSFSEFQTISRGVTPVRDLEAALRDKFKNANSAKDIYDAFYGLRSKISRYWTKADHLDIPKYLQYGTLPFMAAAGNPAVAFDQLERSIDRILGYDVTKIGRFDADTIGKIPQVLYSVADSEAASIHSLSTSLAIPRPTLTRIFDALEEAEILYRLEPIGSHTSQIRQANKYLFSTPAIRAMYFSLTGSSASNTQLSGHLLEDAVGLYLRRLFGERSLTTSINYCPQKGAADFIVKHKQTTFVIEVSQGKKTYRQIESTEKVPADRIGVIIANNDLTLNEEKNIVTIPLREFLML